MKQTTNLETSVGIFMLLGVALICTLVVLFGEVPDLFKPTYTLTVQFPNASGLLKGSDVYLAGALIGKVATDPRPIPDTDKVEVTLKIDKAVEIRQNASYSIGSSGLLGDKFVDVKPVEYPAGTPEDERAPYVRNGEVIEGTASPGIETILGGAQPLIVRANHIATQLDGMITRLNTQVLSDTSDRDLRETIARFRQLADNGDSLVTNANDILRQVKTGDGVLGRLIYDKQVGANFSAFIANLKVHGPLFYRDDFGKKGVRANGAGYEDLRKKYE